MTIERVMSADGTAIAAKELAEAAAGDRRPEAVELFLTKVIEVPAPAVAQMRKAPMWPGLEKLAHTLSYDLLIAGGGVVAAAADEGETDEHEREEKTHGGTVAHALSPVTESIG